MKWSNWQVNDHEAINTLRIVFKRNIKHISYVFIIRFWVSN